VLLDTWHEDTGQGWYVVGPPGHLQVVVSQIDVQQSPPSERAMSMVVTLPPTTLTEWPPRLF
jgi:hypothetical protein